MSYEYTVTNKDELEDNLDSAKTAILRALVKDGIIKDTVAEEWCEKHTIILKKKGIFKTLTDKFKNTESNSTYLMLVVKKV